MADVGSYDTKTHYRLGPYPSNLVFIGMHKRSALERAACLFSKLRVDNLVFTDSRVLGAAKCISGLTYQTWDTINCATELFLCTVSNNLGFSRDPKDTT